MNGFIKIYNSFSEFPTQGQSNIFYFDNEYSLLYLYDLSVEAYMIVSTMERFKNLWSGFNPGYYYDYGISSEASTTKVMSANEIILSPCVLPERVSIDRLSLYVAGAVALSSMKFLIFDSDSDGVLNELIYQSANVATTSVGTKSVALAQTLEANTPYWIGILSSHAITVNALERSACYNLGQYTVTYTCCSLRAILGSYVAPTDMSGIGSWASNRHYLNPAKINFRVA